MEPDIPIPLVPKAEGDPRKIRVLMYHHVTHDKCGCSEPWHCVGIDEFRAQLDWLDRRGYVTITFKDYLLFLEGKLSLPRKPVILTFDDGYQDFYHNAFPLLDEFGMKAVIFVMGDRSLNMNTWDENSDETDDALLTDQQVLELHEAGYEIGSHSLCHPRLTAVPANEAWEEISRSRIVLEILLNARVTTFAYPYGLANLDVKQLVSDAGYAFACSTYSGPAVFGTEPFELRRITVPKNTGRIRLALKLAPWSPWYLWLRWKLKEVWLDTKKRKRRSGEGSDRARKQELTSKDPSCA